MRPETVKAALDWLDSEKPPTLEQQKLVEDERQFSGQSNSDVLIHILKQFAYEQLKP